MPNDWFEFKRFRVEHGNASFKVGTDACLLGAWASVERAAHTLDIGTGSGVIALMVAQRSKGLVTGIDLDASNVEQARSNFDASLWGKRMHTFHAALQQFQAQVAPFDHLICNPPFFHASTNHSDVRSHHSRHDDQLPIDELFKHAMRLSSSDGKLSMIYPMDRYEEVGEQAAKNGWHWSRQVRIKPTNDKHANRLLGEWKRSHQEVETDELIIYNPDRSYTEAVRELLSPFYLNL